MRFLTITCCLAALVYVLPSFSQDSVHVDLNLQLIEKISLDFAKDEIIEIRSGKTDMLIQTVVSDEEGQIESSFSLPNDSAWFYLVPKSFIRIWDENLTFEGIKSDTAINLRFELYPGKVCWDSFLVPYIYFVPNTTKLVDTSDFPDWVKASQEISAYGTTHAYQLKIKSYCGYNESKRLAKKRLDMISIDLLANGWPIDNLTFEVCSKKELFICQYCDGCHYHYLKGRGTTINRKILRSQTEEERLRLENLRSCVTLEWYREEAE